MIVYLQNKLLAICALALLLCGCSEPIPAPEFNDKPYGLISIAHLKTMAKSEPHTITEDISIEGYVVANDLYGEYYKSIVICDDSGGIEISVDARQTAKIFPGAAKVTLHCTSLSIARIRLSRPSSMRAKLSSKIRGGQQPPNSARLRARRRLTYARSLVPSERYSTPRVCPPRVKLICRP